MELPAEVLIYLQTVKKYFQTNQEAREYFISDSNEDVFFKHLCEISEKNFKQNGDGNNNKLRCCKTLFFNMETFKISQ